MMIRNLIIVVGVMLCSCSEEDVVRRNEWTKMSAFPGGARSRMFSFSIGNRGFVGGGFFVDKDLNAIYYHDLWEYTPEGDQWLKRGDLPSELQNSLLTYTVGDYAYLMTFGLLFWEYNSVTDTWGKKANFPDFRTGQGGFVMNGRIYAGCGAYTGDQKIVNNDWWEYDPTVDSWLKKKDIPFEPRTVPFSFTTQNNGYLGLGFGGNTHEDFWMYEVATDTWVEKSKPKLNPVEKVSGFLLGETPFALYFTSGSNTLSQLTKYDPTVDEWESMAPLVTEFKREYTIFTISNTAFYVGGVNGNLIYSDQVWKYEY